MKLFTSAQIKNWDAFTIQHEPIASIDLMERAAQQCTNWFISMHPEKNVPITIFCGNGNNGGDGLAMARILLAEHYNVQVILSSSQKRSEENKINLSSLKESNPTCIAFFSPSLQLPEHGFIIDALLGTGLQGALRDEETEMIQFINKQKLSILSIDIPSGMFADIDQQTSVAVQANYTLTFQQYKQSFLFPEAFKFTGKVIVLPIGLHSDYYHQTATTSYLIDKLSLQSIYQPRNTFSHKGNFGHCLLIAGSHGKMGAAILSARACLRSGAGLVSISANEKEQPILQIAIPEAMTISQANPLDISNYTSIILGCGSGVNEEMRNTMQTILSKVKHPVVIDADALNTIAEYPSLLKLLPQQSILTPHIKELDRLIGTCNHSIDRHKKQLEMSMKYNIYILRKGKHSCITTPEGVSYFNTTGNAGMATAGSGDVLAGIIGGLFAQYQNILAAALMGVYIHGLAGDLYAEENAEESLIANDLIENLGKAFRSSFYTL
jgi:hydroxyethylthiazole kinase-like uncharacterized protein yjeF